MIVAIASAGNNVNATIDNHFARCSHFALFDTDTGEVDFIENLCRTLENNVGLAVVECLHGRNVKKIISGEFGIRVKPDLDRYAIQMIVMTDHTRKIKDIIRLLKSNKKGA